MLWLALRVPHFGARFSFNWDSANYARGVAEFNILKQQPHPPGYILWVLSARALTPLTGGPMQAQVVVAFVMSLLALAVFYALARQLFDTRASLIWTILLAYSPAVALNSSVSSTSIVDLASSSVAGYLAFLDPRRKQWRIVACMIAIPLLGGFRQSGLGMVAPLVAGAALIHWRHAWRAICAGAVLGVLVFLAWYIPMAQSVGGWRVLSRATSEHYNLIVQLSSVFYGGPVWRHLGMIAEGLIWFGMNLCTSIVALGLMSRWERQAVPRWWLFALWLAPIMIMVFGIHTGRVGLYLLAFPPLLLLCALMGKPRLSATLAPVIISLAISYFPYGQFQFSKLWKLNYILYRGTSRMALDIETSQRKLDPVLRDLQHSADTQVFVCARELPDAPNLASVRYDFGYLNWLSPDTEYRGRSIWLFNQLGPDATLRRRFENWRRIMGDQLISLWEASP